MRRRVLLAVGIGAVAAIGLGVITSGISAAPASRTLLNPNHECSFCHLTHNGQQPSLLVNSNVEVLCLTCHGPAGPSSLKAANHVGHTCLVCHNPHDGEFNRFGTRNLMMLRASVVPRDSTTVRPLTFESRGTDAGQASLHSFCDNDQDHDAVYDNVCDTCHRSSPDFHRYAAVNSHTHYPGRTCTNCHTHRRGFRPE